MSLRTSLWSIVSKKKLKNKKLKQDFKIFDEKYTPFPSNANASL
jgi:hypothetical protein